MKHLQTLVKEMIPVILGILIALFINNWKEENDDKKFINSVMFSISKELGENIKELKEVITSQEKLRDTINFYKEDPEIAIGTIINKSKGVQAANIKSNAWRALINTKIDMIEYEKVSILTNIDEDKANMNIKLKSLSDIIYKNLGSTKYLDKELFQITINDLLYTERNLLESHKKFIELKNNSASK